jgi:hypothetical protein
MERCALSKNGSICDGHDEMPFAQATAQVLAKEPEFPDSDFQPARDSDAVCHDMSIPESAIQTCVPMVEAFTMHPLGWSQRFF